MTLAVPEYGTVAFTSGKSDATSGHVRSAFGASKETVDRYRHDF